MEPAQTGNIVAEILFPCRANGETFVEETKCFWKKSETFFVSQKQKCFRNKRFLSAQTGKHLGKQQSVPQQCFLVCGRLKKWREVKCCSKPFYLKGCISQYFFVKLWFVINALNFKTVIVLKLVQYRLILANSAYGLVGLLSGDIALAFAL